MPRSDEKRFSKDKDSFYYLAIKNNKSRPKADKSLHVTKRAGADVENYLPCFNIVFFLE